MTGETPEITSKLASIPELNISNIKQSISNNIDSKKEEEKIIPKTKDTYLYKWRDDKGVMHYTSEKPTGETKSLEAIKLSNKTNVIPANTENINSSVNNNYKESPSTKLPTNIYSPEGIKHLFDQAKDIQNLMDEQFTKQEVVLE